MSDGPEPDLIGSSLPVPASLVADAATHAMLDSIYPYVEQKIHQDIRRSSAGSLTVFVRGLYLRPPQAEPADSEMPQKQFNWHRPTTTTPPRPCDGGADTIILNCFPSLAYVQHYAGLVATYLSLTGRDRAAAAAAVRYIPPAPRQCITPFLASNLRDMGRADIVVVGYAYRLPRLLQTGKQAWITGRKDREEEEEGRGRGGGNLFAWQKRTLPGGRTVTYLECAASMWGDASGHLVRALRALNGVRCVVYVGKTGSLRPADVPNELLATGGRSYLDDGENGGDKAVVEWDNVLAAASRRSGKAVLEGDIVTVASPLGESATWLARWQPRCSWVDCEVGYMALAAREGGTDFGYLHIVSDNVACCGKETLANEDSEHIQQRRNALFGDVEDILEGFFDDYGKSAPTERVVPGP
ncbi:hypothetical protein C8A05DRAFT_32397 [Staphylotrichum tortipilum]|uniref:Nucleoside phosphorylase domain-containing protein n=1 Tax=Staphylotrichum tortipilum TaxID=2831512 RepID=A0AAN6MP12_9PEZI|nr:hypothetical protein C8A05DRAFT_32397 [Staphylotrichum longicolle]